MKKLLTLLVTLFMPLYAEVTLQVLGSGGPESTDGRASSAYLVWVDGKAKVLVDFGGGAMLRYEESGAKIEDLELILLTHLHVDHSADLPALLKASFFTPAKGTLQLFGPDKNHIMPSTASFINRLFQENKGAWQYLGDNLNGDALLQLKPHTIKKTMKPKTIYHKDGIKVQAISVHHGPIPALAYRVDIGDKSITFSGDMNGEYKTLEKLALNTDILVAHNAIPSDTKGVAAKLHMKPFTIGEIAKKANVGEVVLSHRMKRTLGNERETQCEIRLNYEEGEVHYANDGDKFPL